MATEQLAEAVEPPGESLRRFLEAEQRAIAKGAVSGGQNSRITLGELGGFASGRSYRLVAPFGPSVSLDRAFVERQSFRDFTGRALSLEQIGSVLRGVLSVVNDRGEAHFAYPSPGGYYSVYVIVTIDRCSGAHRGHYLLDQAGHCLDFIVPFDGRLEDLINAPSTNLANAAAVITLVLDFPRLSARYGAVAYRYGLIETGAMVQTMSLSCEGDVGLVVLGGLQETLFRQSVAIPAEHLVTGSLAIGSKVRA